MSTNKVWKTITQSAPEYIGLGPATGYVDLLDNATTKKLNDDKESGKSYQKNPLRPSAAGSCTRELFYELMQYSGRAKFNTETTEPPIHRLLNLGHSIEYHLIKQFELLKDVFDIRYKQQVLSFAYLEAKNDKKLNQWVEGSLDLVLWSEKHKCVVDVKSKGDRHSVAFKSKWDEFSDKLNQMSSIHQLSNTAYWVDNLDAFLEEVNDPFLAANFLQLNLYANSGFLKERGVDHGAIIQYNKNDSRLREIRFRPSLNLYNKVINKYQAVINAVDAGDQYLAPRDYMLGSIKCAFCKFKGECWPGKDTTKEFFNTFPKREWPQDTERLGEAGMDLEALFETLKTQDEVSKDKTLTETKILDMMQQSNVTKVRLLNKEVYEAKQLKERVTLKRSKV